AMINSTAGETVSFLQPSVRFFQTDSDAHLNNYISEQADPSKCLLCEWNYGRGKIFYAADYEGTINGRNLEGSLNLIGKRADFGTLPSNSIDVIAIKRVAVMEGLLRYPVAINILIWR
ncbi:MAG: hypothetical protein ABIF01_05085, partial [Candidatus Micrarchaeota archaeon]